MSKKEEFIENSVVSILEKTDANRLIEQSPDSSRFQLTADEYQVLKLQIVTSSMDHGIRSEELPPEEELKKLERRFRSAGMKTNKGSELPERRESGE